MKKNLVLFSLLATGLTGFCQVKLPGLFGDNMVLQRDKPVPVWGTASANEKVTVKFNGQTKTTKAAKNGHWSITLDATPAGGPFELAVMGKNNVALKNILMGDVWVCSGQSNMEWVLKNSNNAAAEIAAASYPLIRHFEVTKAVAAMPKDDIAGGSWKECTPANAGNFTAVGYFFARELVKELNIPVGLINTSWGGTHSETWTSRQAFENDPEFKTMIAGMPSLDLDSLAKVKTAAALQKIKTLQGDMAQTDAVISTWKAPAFDDSKWPVLKIPGLWESQQLGDFDGVVWFRKKITLSAADAGKEAVLELAMIDDADETYVNGTKVGATNSYNEKRKYTIPAGVLKEGANVIAVRVLDTGGGGGIYGEASDLKLTVGGNNIPLAGDWQYQVVLASAVSTASVGPNSYPTLLYNAMLSPLIPYAIKGVIWYQGESNADRAYQYRKAFPLMITDWRNHWKQGNFPFYFVQLASYNSANGNSANGSSWAELREAQTMTLSLPNTGMAVTTDIGEPKDIHPRNKQDVGKRLAAVALHNDYAKHVEYSGPVYQSMQTDGNKITLSFTHAAGGLMAKNKYGYLTGFEIAGADKKFYYAKAMIAGDKVIVFADEVTNPVAVRFGWADDAGDDNLFNKEGFPAGPFRTDDWQGITTKGKFEFSK